MDATHSLEALKAAPIYDVQALPPRIAAKVSVSSTTGCWDWLGCTDKEGRGKVGWRGASWVASRCVYSLLVGPIPEGLELDHLCERPICVNPGHLEPVTHAENMRRRYASTTHCAYGHPYNDVNTYWRSDGRGRVCRPCRNRRWSAWYARQAAARGAAATPVAMQEAA